ncbi:MAG: serine/threonine-protein kinase [Planctomycetaceae bacterium]|nr:serine/threonine-protein kinase [Planctomycetaceae bacterium]
MQDNLKRFIFDRAVAEYVYIYKAGNAPRAEQYAKVWPEYAETLVEEILLAEFKQRCETASLSVEVFLREHPDYCGNENILIRLLEHELEIADDDPDIETVSRRFPQVDQQRLSETVELVQLRRELKPKKKVASPKPPVAAAEVTIDAQPQGENAETTLDVHLQDENAAVEATIDVPPQDEKTTPISPSMGETTGAAGDVTIDVQPSSGNASPVSSSPAETDMWAPERSKTIDWEDKQSETDDTAVGSHQEKADPRDAPETFTVSYSLTVDKFLGRGFWKDVYKAKQHSTQQFVALKHLREKNDSEREALVREVRTQAMLTHQNIPPVFALDVLPSGQAIVVEKLVDGSRWSDTIKTRTIDDNLRILLEVSQAVAFAHRQHKIIHRDLKPDNVVINDKYGEVYVIDWGLAADFDENQTNSDDRVPHVSRLNGIAGTPLYWSPELAGGKPTKCCPATDVFLLGALLYEMLTGHAPYELCNPVGIKGLIPQDIAEIRSLEVGPMLRAVRGVIIPPRLWAPHRYIPDELLDIVMKSLAYQPENRYTDAGDFVDAIKRYQNFAIITNRCDQNWKSFNALRKERDQTLEQPDALLSLTLRFIETSDVFRSVAAELQLHQIADEVKFGEDQQTHATLFSAQRGEVEARTELIDLTLRSGDLTLADAQIGLVERNPLHDAEKLRVQQNSVRILKASRKRAKMMKWVAVAMLGIFLCSSVVYAFLIKQQYQRAEANLNTARDTVQFFLTDVAKDPVIKNSGLMPLRHKLLKLAQETHKVFVEQKSNDPEVIAGQVGALFDIAGIVRDFGNRDESINYFVRAVELGEKLVEKYPKNDKYLNILAKCYKDLGVVYREEDINMKNTMNCYLKALVINRQLVSEHGNVADYHRNLARILQNLGTTEMKQGNNAEAERYFRESVAVREGMTKFDDPPEYHYGIAQTYCTLALAYVLDGRFDDAAKEFETALRFLGELLEKYPERFQNEENLLHGNILLHCGEMNLKADKPDDARSYFVRALVPYGTLVEKSPEHVGYQRQYNEVNVLLFDCLVSENKDVEALKVFQQREASLLETAAAFPEVVQFLCDWYYRIAKFYLERGSKEEAVKALKEGLGPLEVLEDERTPEEEALFKKIQTLMQKITTEK